MATAYEKCTTDYDKCVANAKAELAEGRSSSAAFIVAYYFDTMMSTGSWDAVQNALREFDLTVFPPEVIRVVLMTTIPVPHAIREARNKFFDRAVCALRTHWNLNAEQIARIETRFRR